MAIQYLAVAQELHKPMDKPLAFAEKHLKEPFKSSPSYISFIEVLCSSMVPLYPGKAKAILTEYMSSSSYPKNHPSGPILERLKAFLEGEQGFMLKQDTGNKSDNPLAKGVAALLKEHPPAWWAYANKLLDNDNKISAPLDKFLRPLRAAQNGELPAADNDRLLESLAQLLKFEPSISSAEALLERYFAFPNLDPEPLINSKGRCYSQPNA